MRAKLTDVARVAGVSLTTASFAIRGSARVSAATRARVVACASKLGYTPDPTAQTLASGAARKDAFHGTIALLIPAKDIERVRRRAPGSFFDALPDTAASLGYACDMLPIPETRRGAVALARTLLTRGIRGMIVVADNLVMPDLGFPWEKFAVVLLDSNSGDDRFHRINTHSFNDAYNAVRRCYERGYRRFGLAVNARDFPDWVGGFESAIHSLRIAPDCAVCDSLDWDEPLFVKWFKRTAPEVVIANHGAKPLDALAKLGLRAPEDFGLFALDLNEVRPGVSGWHQTRARAHQLAVESLHGLLRRNEFGLPDAATLIDVAGQWIEGETLRSAPPIKR